MSHRLARTPPTINRPIVLRRTEISCSQNTAPTDTRAQVAVHFWYSSYTLRSIKIHFQCSVISKWFSAVITALSPPLPLSPLSFTHTPSDLLILTLSLSLSLYLLYLSLLALSLLYHSLLSHSLTHPLYLTRSLSSFSINYSTVIKATHSFSRLNASNKWIILKYTARK